MTTKQAERWAKAGKIARDAMGRERRVRGDTRERWRADEDPLAWWCLTELIYGLK